MDPLSSLSPPDALEGKKDRGLGAAVAMWRENESLSGEGDGYVTLRCLSFINLTKFLEIILKFMIQY